MFGKNKIFTRINKILPIHQTTARSKTIFLNDYKAYPIFLSLDYGQLYKTTFHKSAAFQNSGFELLEVKTKSTQSNKLYTKLRHTSVMHFGMLFQFWRHLEYCTAAWKVTAKNKRRNICVSQSCSAIKGIIYKSDGTSIATYSIKNHV